MSNPADVVVVGGGAVGSACAWALSGAGARVTVVQRPDTPGEAWRAAAGMLAAQIEARADDPLLTLALAGRSFYRRRAAELRESTGIDIGLIECGALQVAQTEAEVADLQEQVAWQRQQAHHADWLDVDDVRDGWPWLAPCLGAFWSPDDGALDPARLVAAFQRGASARGVTFVADVAVGLERSGDRLMGVVGEQRRYSAPIVVIAAGAWAGRLENLPRPLSVEPVRGQMLEYRWPAGVPPTIVYGNHCYLMYRGAELLAGSTMEHVGFDVQVTSEGIADVRRRVGALYSPVAAGAPERSWAGLRPGTPDGLPIIGPEPRLSGLWYATGHGRNGILLAGITGELIARGVSGEAIGTELAAVRPTRFWSW
ncbi:MAG TPA: glycine oxidase ThiO [Gemmatimonadales bacterium]|jgi:glycine oxidase|nr:glycine oxidase ThiO [Gemmatimonadales bacterium]